jgi:hypothetical protein
VFDWDINWREERSSIRRLVTGGMARDGGGGSMNTKLTHRR